VTFQAIRDGKGLTWDTYQEGLNAWRRMKWITIPSNPSAKPVPVVIGYTGQSRTVIDLVQRGEGRVHRAWTCRWGFGLYVTDHPGMYVSCQPAFTFLVLLKSLFTMQS
jgi:magnesium-dependent phosphatase 1